MTFNPDDAFETAEDLQNAGRARHEKEILAALPKVQKLPDKTIYPLALAELAFTQTCQKKFAEATENLDKAEAEAISDTADIRVRILRGRGFILQESDALDQALAFYQQSYDLSQQHGLDYDAVEAANMMAHASHDVDEKIKWHKRAIAISEVTKDPHVSNPPAALYCALGRNYIEAGL